MPFVKVATLSQLPVDSVTEVAVGDDFYALCNDSGTVRAMSGICSHQGGPLGQGNFDGGRVICPWHAWEWDCRTGRNCDNPDDRLPTFEVKVEGDDIFLQVP